MKMAGLFGYVEGLFCLAHSNDFMVRFDNVNSVGEAFL